MPIHEWPEEDRPREKLLNNGVAVLSDAELLAVLIGSGTKGKSAVDVGRALLIQRGSLRNLFNCGIDELSTLEGIGKATFARMQAALELSRRCFGEKMKRNTPLDSPQATRAFLHASLRDKEHEVFGALILDNQHRVITFEILFEGTLDQSVVYPREFIKKVLKYNAAAVIIVHNHPSGLATPSQADIDITKQLYQALMPIGIRLLDHFIVGDDDVLSLLEQGLFP
ncbi:MAG: DNA repair protein RadC [Gammaproteobacteria bacterium]|nr:DNA repair protein RadC [Gammaproteobacteria bacterium]